MLPAGGPRRGRAPAPDEAAAPSSWVGAALLAALLGLFLGLIAHTVLDPDIFGHLRYGLDTLRRGSPVATDAYSFLSAGRQWLDDEWLTEVALTGAWLVAGEPALLALKAIFASVILLLAVRPLLRIAGGARVAAVVLPTLVLLFMRMLPLRAQLFSELLFLLTLLVLVRAEEDDRRWLPLLPLIFFLWANFHGAWILGLALLTGWCVVHAWARRALPRAALLALGAAALATALNPWGLGLHAFLLRTAAVPRPDVIEWRPLELASATGLAYVATLLIALVGLVGGWQRKHAGTWAVLGVTAVIPITAVRHTDIFALAALVIAAPHALRAWERRRPDRGRRVGIGALAPFLLVAAAATYAVAPFPGACLAGVPGNAYPVRAVKVLGTLSRPLDVVVPFDWGEYVSFAVGPTIRVSNDARYDTAYEDSIRAMGWDFDRGARRWDRVLGFGPQLVLLRTGSRVDTLMSRRAGWQAVYSDETARIFAPAGSALAAPVAAAAAEVRRAEPGDTGTCTIERSAPPDLARR